jgi:hypothetical protein
VTEREKTMTRLLLVLLTVCALPGCGVETAATAATAASIKQQEMEQAQRTL